ncbi:MAG: uroporphyrinogen decarboxylase family protein [bacterium]|nr:uroporphyrinogen decarboxylase family protein [bacterium]
MCPADLKQLNELLKLIEERIDLEHCKKVDARYRAALSYEAIERPPLVIQSELGKNWKLPAPWDKFKQYPYCLTFNDPVAMMQNQLLDRVVPGLILKDDNPLAIRNDHGTIQIASLLGGQWHMHEDNYPWVGSLGSIETVKKLVEEDNEVDLQGGVMPQSIKTLKFYTEQFSKYTLCKQAVQISLPDLQGPIDTADILWGSEIFAELLANPKLVTAFMNKIANTMITVAEYYRRFAYDRLEPFANTQHGYNIPGRLLIRNDSSIMVSPDTYREMILPHDARLLKEIGTGSIHFCGNGQHLIEPMLEIPDLCGIDLGQSEMMDIKKIYGRCTEKNVAITNLKPSREDLISGKAIRDYPTGVVFLYHTENIDDAIEVVDRYNERGK